MAGDDVAARVEQEKADAKKSWRVRSISKKTADGRLANSTRAKEHTGLWTANAEEDLAEFDNFAQARLKKPKEQKRQRTRSARHTAVDDMTKAMLTANTAEVMVEFEQSAVSVQLNPAKERKVKFNIVAEDNNKKLELRLAKEKDAARRKQPSSNRSGATTAVDLNTDATPLAGDEILRRIGLKLIELPSSQTGNSGVVVKVIKVDKVLPNTQASRRFVQRLWTVSNVAALGDRKADGDTSEGAARGAEPIEVKQLAELRKNVEDILQRKQVQHKQGLPATEVCGEFEVGFTLPRGIKFYEPASLKFDGLEVPDARTSSAYNGWEVSDVGKGSDADIRGIKHGWTLLSINGISLDDSKKPWRKELQTHLKSADLQNTSRNDIWLQLIDMAKKTDKALDLLFRMPKYVPKIRSLTGGVFGESDPLSLENSILSAKQRDRSLTFAEWQHSGKRLLKTRLALEGRQNPMLEDDKLLEAAFDSIDAKRTTYLNRYAPELPSFIETVCMCFWHRRALRRRLGCEMMRLYAWAIAHKFLAMVKMLFGFWDQSLIYDTEIHIYKTRFYSHSAEESVDQVDDMRLVGSTHSFFWIFLPFRAFAVLTKLGERNNESPAYVANTVDVGAKVRARLFAAL